MFRLNHQTHTQRLANLGYRFETRAGVGAQRLVQRLPAYAGGCRDTRHPPSARDDAQGMRQSAAIALVDDLGEIGGDVFIALQIAGGIEIRQSGNLDRLFAHGPVHSSS